MTYAVSVPCVAPRPHSSHSLHPAVLAAPASDFITFFSAHALSWHTAAWFRIFPRCCDYTKLLAQCLIALGYFFLLNKEGAPLPTLLPTTPQHHPDTYISRGRKKFLLLHLFPERPRCRVDTEAGMKSVSRESRPSTTTLAFIAVISTGSTIHLHPGMRSIHLHPETKRKKKRR